MDERSIFHPKGHYKCKNWVAYTREEEKVEDDASLRVVGPFGGENPYDHKYTHSLQIARFEELDVAE